MTSSTTPTGELVPNDSELRACSGEGGEEECPRTKRSSSRCPARRPADPLRVSAATSRQRHGIPRQLGHVRGLLGEDLERRERHHEGRRAAGGVAGNTGSWEQDGRREIGYWIGMEHWGKGVATKAVSLPASGRDMPSTRMWRSTTWPHSASCRSADSRIVEEEPPGSGRVARCRGARDEARVMWLRIVGSCLTHARAGARAGAGPSASHSSGMGSPTSPPDFEISKILPSFSFGRGRYRSLDRRSNR